jgi:hypothetical protein
MLSFELAIVKLKFDSHTQTRESSQLMQPLVRAIAVFDRCLLSNSPLFQASTNIVFHDNHSPHNSPRAASSTQRNKAKIRARIYHYPLILILILQQGMLTDSFLRAIYLTKQANKTEKRTVVQANFCDLDQP